MKSSSPDPPGTGYIRLSTNGEFIDVQYKGKMIDLARLFYTALKEIPSCYPAMLTAIMKYEQDNPGHPKIKHPPFS